MSSDRHVATAVLSQGIDHSASGLPVPVPRGYVGEFVIPGTGRRVWWTGRVAIGLRHQPEPYFQPLGRSSLWIQELMLGKAHS